ncbi:MAG: NAD(P)-dependent oxidoreductase [Saprospiraceae bacterium]|nr:NAD(P)-dependent oxidoreductase [Saprospiraceae bacterium]
MKNKIIITGAAGFIGSELVKYFNERNYEVTAFIYVPPKVKLENVNYVKFELNEEFDESYLAGCDMLIHCAYMPFYRSNNANQINIEGTKNLLDACRRNGVKKFLFLSSLSAREDALSNYGKVKFELEKIFDLSKDLIIRPGLVIGNGGLFLNMKNVISKSKYIPMIGGGKQPLQTIYIQDLAESIEFALENNIIGKYSLAAKEPKMMKDFYKALATKLGKEVVLVNFPYFLADFSFWLIKTLRISMKITKENLLGLKQMKVVDVSEDLKTFKLNPKTCIEILKLM